MVSSVGDKARALGVLADAGVPTVDGVVVLTDAYREFVDAGDAMAVALAEIDRRVRVRARAEEYWDSSQRIRGAFFRTLWPESLRAEVLAGLGPWMGGPLVIRSSASHVSCTSRTLVRMYDSMSGVQGTEAVLRAITSVWASLFSDRALLYRDELGLDPTTSAMAVIVQPALELQAGGIAYTRHPLDTEHIVVEAVRGPVDTLTSGLVEPHRWVVERESVGVREHAPPSRAHGDQGTGAPPLDDEEVVVVSRLSLTAERVLGEAQAVEFAKADGAVVVLESRAIAEPPDDERRSYLAVRLPESRLQRRRERIAGEYLPSMWSEANALSVVDISRLSDHDLAAEALRRAEAVAHWRHVYRTVLAPFAHGQRLFGEYYVRMLAPEDPFGFIGLLARTPEEYQHRRQILAELGIEPPDVPAARGSRDADEAAFLAALPDGEREHASWLLGLARASWSMRDDDNLYLKRIESEAVRALAEIEQRLKASPGDALSVLGPASREQLSAAAEELRALRPPTRTARADASRVEIAERPNQLGGDAAAPGVGCGVARVVRTLDDARALRRGEVMVMDELEPEAAAYAVRASAIVEGRGGMFAHGAVLSREHGLPCVTGICDATSIIRDGESLTVNGDRGIVVFKEA